MTGKAIAAKTATGDEPVFAYIASLPQPQCGIAERIDALTAKMRVRGAYRRGLVSPSESVSGWATVRKLTDSPRHYSCCRTA
jgi:hypothetical protein